MNEAMPAHSLTSRAELMHAFIRQSGWGDAALNPLKGDASFRRYVRLNRGAESAMLMDAPPQKENVQPYLAITRHLAAHGYSAPSVLAEDSSNGFLLIEDLGDAIFTPVLVHHPDSEQELYSAATDVLAAWARDTALNKHSSMLAIPDYTHAEYMREALLFSEWFLPQVLSGDALIAAQRDYASIWNDALGEAAFAPKLFVHRDYHADNLLWLPERGAPPSVIGLLDFQDALWGHAAYDLASLLEDARRDVPPALAEACIRRYVRATEAQDAQFRHDYSLLAAQRNCKIIGIFWRLKVRDGKPNYLNFLPRVWAHLRRDVEAKPLAPLARFLSRTLPEFSR